MAVLITAGALERGYDRETLLILCQATVHIYAQKKNGKLGHGAGSVDVLLKSYYVVTSLHTNYPEKTQKDPVSLK